MPALVHHFKPVVVMCVGERGRGRINQNNYIMRGRMEEGWWVNDMSLVVYLVMRNTCHNAYREFCKHRQ